MVFCGRQGELRGESRLGSLLACVRMCRRATEEDDDLKILITIQLQLMSGL